MLVQGKLLSIENDLSDVYYIRREVFINEMKLPESIVFDDQDEMAMNVIVYEEVGSKKAVATGRICFDGEACEISHVAVLKEFRRKKYGDFAVRMLINKAFTSGFHEVKSIVNSTSIKFFENIGFHIVDENKRMQDIITVGINVNDITTPCQKLT